MTCYLSDTNYFPAFFFTEHHHHPANPRGLFKEVPLEGVKSRTQQKRKLSRLYVKEKKRQNSQIKKKLQRVQIVDTENESIISVLLPWGYTRRQSLYSWQLISPAFLADNIMSIAGDFLFLCRFCATFLIFDLKSAFAVSVVRGMMVSFVPKWLICLIIWSGKWVIVEGGIAKGIGEGEWSDLLRFVY